jgi:primase-polymerase (primpol)-like protein
VNVAAIPAELRERPQWVTWKFEPRPGEPKPTKVPYRPDDRGRAKVNRPETWGTFEQAVATFERGSVKGVGYVLSTDDPYTGLDFDDCRGDDGVLHPAVTAILDTLASYAEASPSGHGVRVFIRASLNGFPHHVTSKTPWKGRAEVYDCDRFQTVTGDRVPGCQATSRSGRSNSNRSSFGRCSGSRSLRRHRRNRRSWSS